jgi:hypothetical protein
MKSSSNRKRTVVFDRFNRSEIYFPSWGLKVTESHEVEDIIEASLETIRQAAKDVLGGDPKEDTLEDGTITFTKNVSECPAQIKLIPVQKDRFRIISTSVCNIRDCDYWQRCAQLDSENMEDLKEAVAKLQGKAFHQEQKKWIFGEGRSRHVVDDAVRR